MPSEKALKTRQAIIESAFTIIHTEGFEALTMDHIAEKASLSKGALTYHFNNKHALHLALIESYVAHMEEEFTKYVSLFTGDEADTMVAGYIEWFKAFQRNNRGWAMVGVSLLSNFALDAELMAPVRQWYQRLFDRIAQLPPERRTPVLVCILAMEGLFYAHKFGIDLIPGDMKKALWPYLSDTVAQVNVSQTKKRVRY